MYTVIVKVTQASLDEVIPNVDRLDVDDLIAEMWVRYPKAFLVRAIAS